MPHFSAFLLDNGFDKLDFDLVKSEILIKPLIVPGLRIVIHIGSQLRRLVHANAKPRELRKIGLPCVIAFLLGIEVQETNICRLRCLCCCSIVLRYQICTI